MLGIGGQTKEGENKEGQTCNPGSPGKRRSSHEVLPSTAWLKRSTDGIWSRTERVRLAWGVCEPGVPESPQGTILSEYRDVARHIQRTRSQLTIHENTLCLRGLFFAGASRSRRDNAPVTSLPAGRANCYTHDTKCYRDERTAGCKRGIFASTHTAPPCGGAKSLPLLSVATFRRLQQWHQVP